MNCPVDATYLLPIQHPRRWLVVLVCCYLVSAANFAITTPAWQAPDEPAHYNYIAHVASGGGLPVLEAGDYNQALVEKCISLGSTCGDIVENLRYESHQPPLYYISAVPIFWLSGGNLVALRLFSALIGVGVIILTFECVNTIFPQRDLISLGAAAFVALLPMHVAVLSAVNNDGLVELLVVATLAQLVRWISLVFQNPVAKETRTRRPAGRLILIGGLIGLGMLTKAGAYVLLPLCGLAVVTVTIAIRRRVTTRQTASKDPSAIDVWRPAVLNFLSVLIPALAIALPIWWHNADVYGMLDPLGLHRHAQVVIGQPRTSEWISTFGWGSYWLRAISITVKSFLGAFGWLTLFMDDWVYGALMLFVTVAFVGLLLAILRSIQNRHIQWTTQRGWQIAAMVLLFLSVLASYVWYNLTFVQHQGRYLFPALVVVGMGVAVGWREAVRPKPSGLIGTALLVMVVVLFMNRHSSSYYSRQFLIIVALFCALFTVQFIAGWIAGSRSVGWQMQTRTRLAYALWVLPFLMMLGLDLVIPYAYIVLPTSLHMALSPFIH